MQVVLPVLPLRDVVVYPHMVIPLFVGRSRSIRALDRAMEVDKRILLVAQKDAAQDEPGPDDIYRVGTVSTILQLLKLPDGTVKVLVEGGQRIRIGSFTDEAEYLAAEAAALEGDPSDERETEALSRSLLTQFEQYVKLNKKVPPEILASLSNIDEPGRLADTVAAHLSVKIEQKQEILEIPDVSGRLEHIISLLEEEIDLLQVEKRIRGRVKRQMEKSQREYYLNEQMKAIQKELGDMDDAPNEIEELSRKIEKAGMTKEAKGKALAELNKLRMMSSMSAEATVVRNYIDWMVRSSLEEAHAYTSRPRRLEAVLDADHYGLEKVKDRIVEYLAVQHRVRKLKGPILCLVGPPGVGKTSLGQSIARATHRKFIRMSLGGVRDEAEIRGHRRTYIGALPGKIVQNLAKVGVRNPLFLLDEVDKMSMDVQGRSILCSPRSARSGAESHVQRSLPGGRLRSVRCDVRGDCQHAEHSSGSARSHGGHSPAGYTEDEKVAIANRYLVPKQMKNNGLHEKELNISDPAMHETLSATGPGKRGCEMWNVRSPRFVARWSSVRWPPTRAGSSAHRAPKSREVPRGETLPVTDRARGRIGWVRPPAWPGPRWEEIS